MSRPSKRFDPNFWSERLVPLLFVIILLGLLITLVVVGLSLAGLTPGI